jgi:hypothetical protein
MSTMQYAAAAVNWNRLEHILQKKIHVTEFINIGGGCELLLKGGWDHLATPSCHSPLWGTRPVGYYLSPCPAY